MKTKRSSWIFTAVMAGVISSAIFPSCKDNIDNTDLSTYLQGRWVGKWEIVALANDTINSKGTISFDNPAYFMNDTLIEYGVYDTVFYPGKLPLLEFTFSPDSTFFANGQAIWGIDDATSANLSGNWNYEKNRAKLWLSSNQRTICWNILALSDSIMKMHTKVFDGDTGEWNCMYIIRNYRKVQ